MTVDIDSQSTKVCSQCKESKRLDEFTKESRRLDGLKPYCKECGKKYAKPFTDEQRAKYNATRKAKRDPEHEKYLKIKSLYNLSREEYNAIFERQGGCCAICWKPEKLVVDHNHDCCPGTRSCGRCVRALLCGHCNKAIGLFKDDPEALVRAAHYIAMTNPKTVEKYLDEVGYVRPPSRYRD